MEEIDSAYCHAQARNRRKIIFLQDQFVYDIEYDNQQ